MASGLTLGAAQPDVGFITLGSRLGSQFLGLRIWPVVLSSSSSSDPGPCHVRTFAALLKSAERAF